MDGDLGDGKNEAGCLEDEATLLDIVAVRGEKRDLPQESFEKLHMHILSSSFFPPLTLGRRVAT